ncbi:MAG: MFS transporter [Proteobacteria bacterium]|nr:MFS transporter [Pseudomonadota bacterium]
MDSTISLKNALRQTLSDKVIALTILVSALGYFVDVFDLLLFSIVRIQSLKDLGVAEADLLAVGIRLLNTQAAGLLVGGIVWGMLADKYGRVSVLFGSILLYSIANIGNGFVTSIDQYAVWRFISGFGLAGELGIGVTLASELLPRAVRGIGTTLIVSFGLLGSGTAVLMTYVVNWHTAYIIGGVLGLCLLVLRLKVRESGLYRKVEKEKKTIKRGSFWMFLRKAELLRRYITVVLIGVPIWAVMGIPITFTSEFAKDFGMAVLPNTGIAILFCQVGVSFGAICAGVLSQNLRSRRKAITIFLVLMLFFVSLFTALRPQSPHLYYLLCALIGIGTGYWGLTVQIGAEQFGTNLRATAAASIPNMIRGCAIPMTTGFHALVPYMGVAHSGFAVVIATGLLAFIALWRVRETFHTDLDYIDGLE